MLLGCGELGKEVAIEAQRLGIEVIGVDRYHGAPAMQVAHRHYVIDMRDPYALKAVVRREQPDVIVPEIEAIATDALLELEEEGFRVIPTARATKITMDRIELRKLAASVGVPTSPFEFAYNLDELKDACEKVGYPCLVKARMSSGGLGTTLVWSSKQVEQAYENARRYARGFGEHVIVERLIRFDFEVTELATAYICDERIDVLFPKPVGHIRVGSHYHVSWQPFLNPDPSTGQSDCPLHAYGGALHREEEPGREPLWQSEWDGKYVPNEIIEEVERQIYEVAGKVVRELIKGPGGEPVGLGLFGCEIMVRLSDPEAGGKPRVYFNEISPRPHDTGMVTLVTQDMSEMALHVRAILGLPIPEVRLLAQGAAHVVLAEKGGSWGPVYHHVDVALKIPGVHLRLFGKPYTYPERRMGLALAIGKTTEEARRKALKAAHILEEGIEYRA